MIKIKIRLTATKRLYEEMKEINDPEIFNSFEEENMIALIKSILTTLEIIQAGARLIIEHKIKRKTMDNNNNIEMLIQDADLKL